MPYASITLAILRQELKDRWESIPFWTDSEATFALNEALRVWNMLTGHWKRRVVMRTSQVGGIPTVWYQLPGSVVYNMRLEFNEFPMESSSLGDLDYGRPTWEGEKTTTTDVPSRPTLWAPAGLTMIALWPADASPPNAITIDGVASTPVLANDGDFVDLQETEHQAILGYALHISSFKGALERFASTQRFYKEFVEAAADMNAKLKASIFFRRAMGLDLNRGQRPLRFAVPRPAPESVQREG